MERRGFVGVTGSKWSAYLHELVAGKRTKLLLVYRGAYRSMLWLDVRPDGSVVVGAGLPAASMERRARRRASDRLLPAKLSAAVGESQVPPGLHMSLHTSGVINVRGVRAYRAPLAGPEPHQLCALDFAHPGLHPPVERQPQDVVLPYSPRDEASVRGRLTIMPSEVVAFFDDAPGPHGDPLPVQTSGRHCPSVTDVAPRAGNTMSSRFHIRVRVAGSREARVPRLTED